MAWYKDIWDFVRKGTDFKDLLKIGTSAGKAYLDYKDQKRRGELEEAAYGDYMKAAEAAGQEAQAAVDLNLTPMTISNIPQTKADITDFTAVAARGGLMSIPNRQRKQYAYGSDYDEVIETDEEEILTPDYLMKEEGVNIGEQVFHDTGDPMTNAQQVWDSGAIDQELYQMDFNLFFESGDWMDHISEREIQENTMMASAPGIEGLRHGGRPGYEMGLGPVGGAKGAGENQGWVSQVSPTKEVDMIHRIYEEQGNDGLAAYLDRNPELKDKYIINADGMSGELFVMPNKLHPDNMDMENIVTIDSGNDVKIMNDMFQQQKAQGGRIKKDNGGIMNLGGMEKDYRTTGGFVPIGAYEKKDDVPARLSKNEFVMTADAVRAAGGGSINKGAQRMYDTMKHLEAQPQAKRMTV